LLGDEAHILNFNKRAEREREERERERERREREIGGERELAKIEYM